MMLSIGERLSNNSIRSRRPKTADAQRDEPRPVQLTNQIMLLDSDVKPFCESPRPRTAVNPQMNRKSLRRATRTSARGQIREVVALPERPSTAVPRRKKEAIQRQRKELTDLPDSEDIANIKKIIKSTRKRTIMWGDSSFNTFNAKLAGEWEAAKEPKRSRFIIDNDPIDINNPVSAAPLISTKALVQDFIGVPTSLTCMM